MITLITGAPGAGKSAALVSLLSELAKSRPVYVNGIPELKIEHQELDEPRDWMGTVPDGSIIVIDEVQRFWRPAGNGQRVPDDIAALETHRHHGLDFYLITQSPKFVHINVRGLVGRHVHLRDLGMLGRWWYEWPECSTACDTAWKTAPIKKRYKLPKKIFSMYKSATEHIKPIRSVPVMLFVAIFAVVATLGGSWFAFGLIKNKIAPPVAVSSSKIPLVPVSGIGSTFSSGQPQPKLIDDRVDWVPRISSKPETAPAYDEIRKVVVMPVVAGGLCSASGCSCITQQGTPSGLSSTECKAWMENPPFNAYSLPAAASVPAVSPSPPKAPAVVPDSLPHKKI